MDYDVIVIGAGPAGKNVALNLEKSGLHVAIIEKDRVGGTCLNEGCIPAKLYLESSSYVAKLKHFSNYGVHVDNLSFDLEELKTKKDELLTLLRDGAIGKLDKSKVEFFQGEATFVDKNSVKVEDKILSADKIIIASGSTHRPHPLLEIDGKQIISSKEVFELKNLPKSVLVVGGGAIGCEFATFFNSLGAEVHIAEFTSQIVPAEDSDVAKALQRELQKKGIKITVDANVTSFEKKQNSIEITMQTKNKELIADYGLVLVSIGRAPNTANLKLENADIQSERGFVTVSEQLQTSTSNIYALGDVIPTPALAHAAYNEADILASNIINNSTCKPSKIIPFVTFCQPQVASIGKNEKTLKAEGTEYKVVKHFFKSSAKAKIKGDDGGFIKLLCEKETGIILGGAMIGHDTTELIHELLIAIEKKTSLEEISKMVFAHPTLSESLWEMTR
ncbi:MAG TPA: dihydrolipoyl dehydrogenase [Sulfurospirillum arcachonense]|nr:dihydrolipoyl dehydrogenase [Sulfurospirillum arcachonense]HIP45579.1 dihydrolipoyl dehydrogenase [Sulfurospirillum arcachonense]